METLALIELLDRDGLPQQSIRVTQWPVRIGRGIDCDVVLDDPHVAAHHATLVARADGVHVEAAPSLNGVHLGRARIASGSAALLPGALLRMGATRLRVRLAGEVLPPEQALPEEHVGANRRVVRLGALAVVAAVWAGFSQWVWSVPGQSGSEAMVVYLGAPIALAVWCSLWALGSKLFQHQFAFWPHLEAALFWPLLAMVVAAFGGQLAFALSAPWVAKTGHVLALIALAMLLWRHLAIVLPQRRRAFAIVIAAMVVVGGGLDLAEKVRHQQPLVGDLYLGTISLPGLRLVKPVSADAFVQSAAPLEKALTGWAKAPGGDELPGEGSDED